MKYRTFIQRFFRFDGLTLLALVVLVSAFLALPIWALYSIALGFETVYAPPGWLDIPARILLAVFFSFLGTYRSGRLYGDNQQRARISITVVGLLLSAAIIGILQFAGVINIIPG